MDGQRRSRGASPGGGRLASWAAGLAFFYALLVTTALLAATGFFSGDEHSEAELLWLCLPIGVSFGSWLAVLSGFAPLRAHVWAAVLLTLFFSWLAVFSFGLLFLPVAGLMLAAVLSPWPAGAGRRDRVSGADGEPSELVQKDAVHQNG